MGCFLFIEYKKEVFEFIFAITDVHGDSIRFVIIIILLLRVDFYASIYVIWNLDAYFLIIMSSAEAKRLRWNERARQRYAFLDAVKKAALLSRGRQRRAILTQTKAILHGIASLLMSNVCCIAYYFIYLISCYFEIAYTVGRNEKRRTQYTLMDANKKSHLYSAKWWRTICTHFHIASGLFFLFFRWHGLFYSRYHYSNVFSWTYSNELSCIKVKCVLWRHPFSQTNCNMSCFCNMSTFWVSILLNKFRSWCCCSFNKINTVYLLRVTHIISYLS